MSIYMKPHREVAVDQPTMAPVHSHSPDFVVDTKEHMELRPELHKTEQPKIAETHIADSKSQNPDKFEQK